MPEHAVGANSLRAQENHGKKHDQNRNPAGDCLREKCVRDWANNIHQVSQEFRNSAEKGSCSRNQNQSNSDTDMGDFMPPPPSWPWGVCVGEIWHLLGCSSSLGQCPAWDKGVDFGLCSPWSHLGENWSRKLPWVWHCHAWPQDRSVSDLPHYDLGIHPGLKVLQIMTGPQHRITGFSWGRQLWQLCSVNLCLAGKY